jgi:transcriptional regulator with XRE-family HTH domain
MTSRETFARNLRKLRKVRGFSQEELAHRAGLDRTYISSLERQRYAPTLDVLDKLASALSIDPALLIVSADK